MFDWFTYELITKFIRFGVVGISGMVVDFGITALCKEGLKIQKYFANGVGFVAAATSNYFFNRIWTFQSNNPEVATEYGMFFLVSIIGLGINTFILYLTIKKFKWNFYFAKIVAIGITMIWNFIANFVITFA